MLGSLRAAGTAGLNLLLPPLCMSCDAPAAAAFSLCARCFAGLHFITAPLCKTCGVPFSHHGQGGPERLCPACRDQPPAFHTARGALAYDANSRALVLPFKHASRTELARLFAPMMARAGAGLLHGADFLVPVPLHRSRLRQRGYNQSALLAQALSSLCGVPALLDALQRPRKTAPMGHHDAASRHDMMQDAITVRPHRAGRIAGRRIVLVDDVMTSGATSTACALALLDADAARVDALVVARVPDPDLDRS